MNLPRFFVGFNLNQKEIVLKDGEIYHQVKNVFRLKQGDKIILWDGNFNETVAKILFFDKVNKNLKVKILERKKNKNELNSEITLYLSILKKDNFELAIQKATETGIKRIVPIICERTVKKGLNQKRLEKIIKEAAEQSQRGVLPILEFPLTFKKAVFQAKQSNNLNLFFDIKGEFLSKSLELKKKKVGIFIGPEGGWAKKEIDLAKNNKFLIVRLSNLVFRAETAAIIASYIVGHFNKFK